jgi:hypothetical protein
MSERSDDANLRSLKRQRERAAKASLANDRHARVRYGGHAGKIAE